MSIPISRIVLGLALAAALPARAMAAAAPSSAPLVVRAAVVHAGDGAVLHDAAVVVEGGLITWVGPQDALAVPPGSRELSAAHLLPGLVVSLRSEGPEDAESVDPLRRAADLDVRVDDDALLDRGITTLRLGPGMRRLVSGRGAMLGLGAGGLRRTLGTATALHASLDPAALAPPPVFDPVLRVHADNPLPPARLQRPFTPMAAAAELRRLLGSGGEPWSSARSGAIPVVIHARAEQEIRRALALVSGSEARLVIEGGDEAPAVAAGLASRDALVVLEPADPQEALVRELDADPRAAALLHAAGVRVALADPAQVPHDPLLLAARAVRAGMPRDAAVAAVTGLPWAASGEPARRIAPGVPADLAAFDEDPLLARARPILVVASGRIVRERSGRGVPDADDEPIALRVGRAIDGDRVVQPATILVRDGRIASVASGEAIPAGVPLIDLGPGSVAVAGFIDAFSRTGLDPGGWPGGSPRIRAADAVEPAHATLSAALRAGLTSALAVPATRGTVIGMASTMGLLSPRQAPPRDGDEPEPPPGAGTLVVDVMSAEAGLVLWADDGPSDGATRQGRLKALKEALQRAKGYHESWSRSEKKPDDEDRGRSRRKEPEKPEKDPALEPWRAVLAGKAKAFLRCGREDLIVPALDALKAAGIAAPVLCGGEEADLVASELASRGITVVLAPGALRQEEGETVNVASELRAAGVKVAFGSFQPGAAAELPLRVAALVREGLSPQDALAGLTTAAAAAAGMPESAGRLTAGARGDVVVFEGDPMEPGSPVRLVLARGRIAWKAEP